MRKLFKDNFFKPTVALLILLFVVGGLLSVSANAQTEAEKITQLREQIEELEKQAEQYKNSIASERAKGDSLKGEINILKSQILKIESQISLTGKKIEKTKIEMTGLENKIFDTQTKITQEQGTLGRLILFVDQNDGENLVVSVLKHRNLSDFFSQSQYAANIGTQLLGLVNGLKSTKHGLEGNKQDLEGKKSELEAFNQKQAVQKNVLNGSKTQKNTLLAQTKGQEAQYEKLLSDVEKKQMEFFTQLRALESNAITGGLFIIHISATNIPPKGTNIFQWPEDDYLMTQGYGCTKRARCGSPRGAYGGAPHNGIDIASGLGTPIKTIGDGEIVANGANNKGWGNWVAVKHTNNMVSVYAHMSAHAPLKVGTAVQAGQVIGYEGSTGHSTGSHLHLSLYKDFFTYTKGDELEFNYFEGTLNPLDYLP